MTNPLLTAIDQPIDYQAIQPEHIEPAVDLLLARAKEKIEQLAEQDHPTWDDLVEPIHDATEQLWRALAVSRPLNAVVNTTEIRRANKHGLPIMSALSH